MVKKIIKFSVKNRYLVLFLTFVIICLGTLSLSYLPIDAVPDITNNQVQINTIVSGFSPFEMEKQVTFTIETALQGIPGLQSTRSLSRNGFSQVTAIFDDKVNIYFARQQVNEKILEVKENLPENADPKMGAISTGLGEVYMWSLSFEPPEKRKIENGKPGWQSDSSYLTDEGELLKTPIEQLSYLRTLQDWVIKPQLKSISGVAGVDAIGGYIKQYHVQPNVQQVMALGLSFAEIKKVIEQNNASLGANYIERNGEALIVRVNGRTENIPQIENIVVATKEGSPIYLKDIAQVEIGKELRTGSASGNGEEVVIGTALMLIGENSRKVASDIEKKFTQIKKQLPVGVIAEAFLNRTTLVDATIKTVSKNLAEGALLVIVILFWMLKNFRAALITASIIPITMLMTSMGMLVTQTSANLMSLGALDFGLLVDGAVIIIENYLQRLALRTQNLQRTLTLKERLDEVIQSAKEMSRPTVYGQAILILVYVPLLSFTGVEGKMFMPMAITVILALASAFILSLTLIPALAAILIKTSAHHDKPTYLDKCKQYYQKILEYALANPYKILGSASVLFVSSLLLFTRLGQEFIPTLDEKNIAMHAMRIPSTSLTQSQQMQLDVEKIIAAFPEVKYVYSKTGTAEMAADPMPPNVSDTFVIFKPLSEWPDPHLKKSVLIQQIEEKVQAAIGHNYEFTQPIQMRFNELISGVRSDVAVKIYGDNFEIMNQQANKIAGLLKTISGAADVKVEQTTGLPTLEFKLHRERMARLGLNVSDVLEVISIAIGGQVAGVVFEGDKRFDIIVKLAERYRQNLEVIENLPIYLPKSVAEKNIITDTMQIKNTSVPLKEVVDIVISDGINQISRENGKRRVVVQANVRGTDIATFVQQAKDKIEAQTPLPAGYWLEWGGQFENLVEAKERLYWVVPACFFMIFMLLFAALGSVREACYIFTAIPLGLSGGIFSLWLRDMPFSISAAVGFIALSGIAVLNGLVMVTTIQQRLEKEPLEKAILSGAVTRLRPVLMTALVASLGFLPMALATGTGAEVQKPLATVVIGGLITSTLLTMIILPVLYKQFSKKKIIPA